MKNITSEFGNWFAGFVDGEGYFGIIICDSSTVKSEAVQFVIKLRRDDRAILEYIQSNLGFGNVYNLNLSPSASENANPQAKFQIGAIPDCMNLLTVFDAYPLRAKKRRDYEIWKQAVILKNKHYDYNMTFPEIRRKLRSLGKELKDARRYVEFE